MQHTCHTTTCIAIPGVRQPPSGVLARALDAGVNFNHTRVPRAAGVQSGRRL